jgi:branched-chain amino acid transport system substrate-binding protein
VRSVERSAPRRRLRPAIAGLMVIMLVAACAGDGADDADADADADGADAATADEDEGAAAAEGLPSGEYDIGFESLTSGPAAFAGVPLAQGARLAVDEINETEFLGEGASLVLHEQDAGGDPARGIAAADRFISQGVSGMLCCALSSAAEPIKQRAAEAETAAIVTSAILPGLPDPPYMFRPVLLPSENAYHQLISQLAETEGPETAVLALTADNDGMVLDGEVWADAAEENGISIVDTVDTRTGDTDFAGPATDIINTDPDVVILSMLGEEATLLTQSLNSRGYEGEIVTTYGISNEANYEIAGEARAGVKFPIPFSAISEHELSQHFTELYREAYGETPDVFAAQGYTAMWMLAYGLQASGDGEPDSVSQALTELDEMDSVYGALVFEDGQAFLQGDMLLLEWQADGSHEIWDP